MIAGPPSSSSGPGRRPFKAVARVRIPLGARCSKRSNQQGPVEQLECSPPCQGGGRGFKSRQDRQRRTPRVIRAAFCVQEHATRRRPRPAVTCNMSRARPGSSVGTSVRLKIGRSAVRPRPWPPTDDLPSVQVIARFGRSSLAFVRCTAAFPAANTEVSDAMATFRGGGGHERARMAGVSRRGGCRGLGGVARRSDGGVPRPIVGRGGPAGRCGGAAFRGSMARGC